MPKRQRDGPVARVVDDVKRGGAGAEANGSAVKGSGGNGGKRRSERSAAKARHGFESDEALKYA